MKNFLKKTNRKMLLAIGAAGLWMLLPGCVAKANKTPIKTKQSITEATKVRPLPDSLGARLDKLSERAKNDPKLAERLSSLLKEARAIARKPIWTRVHTLADYKKLDGINARKMKHKDRCDMMTDRVNAEHHARAIQDSRMAREMLPELPFLAAAYRMTKEPELRDTIVRQLEEMATWKELQRQGWSLTVKKATMKKRDGVWLATGTFVQILILTLDVLPPRTLPPELRKKLNDLLKREQALTKQDWENKTPWYVRARKAHINQWVVPNTTLTLADAARGAKPGAAYRLGAENTAATMAALGSEGAYSEGIEYGIGWTLTSLQVEAHYRALLGDRELWNDPFMEKFPRWVALSYQPGRNIINAFDFWGGSRDVFDILKGGNITQIAALSKDPELNWIVRNKHRWIPPTLFGLLSLGLTDEDVREPPLYGAYNRARWIAWRSAWTEDADGVWFRGQHPLDFHSHHDGGHINYIKNGKIVLLEAGSITYTDPLYKSDFKFLKGHNVLQIGDGPTAKQGVDAPFKVHRLDAKGGDATLDASSIYKDLDSWTRRAQWDKNSLRVTDKVRLKLGKKEPLLFRWHLGTEKKATIRKEAGTFIVTVPAGEIKLPKWKSGSRSWVDYTKLNTTVETPAITLRIKSDTPLTVTQEEGFDHTFDVRQQHHKHTTILVQTASPVNAANIETEIVAK